MKLRKTDKRFNLLKYGFDCYIEFADHEWNKYERYSRHCRLKLGSEFFDFAGRVYTHGNYKCVPFHRNKRLSSKRIYFRGEKYHTLLLIAIPSVDDSTFYL
jgi:hypothetical protein